MYSQASLHTAGSSAEDNMKFHVAFPYSREHYDQNLYVESARRVVFKNCMEKCELDNTQVPNFNKNFYYNMPEAQECLQSCYNFRMQLHFGDAAKTRDAAVVSCFLCSSAAALSFSLAACARTDGRGAHASRDSKGTGVDTGTGDSRERWGRLIRAI